MPEIDWWEFVPAIASAIASIAAAVAAIYSSKVARDTKKLSEQTALATHHQSAITILSETIKEFEKASTELAELGYTIRTNWAWKVERESNSPNTKYAGENPRPIRHVLQNAANMLVNYAAKERRYETLHSELISGLRGGVGRLDDEEFEALLKKADHSYTDIELVFGEPSIYGEIGQSLSCKWVFDQLRRRVPAKSWSKMWQDAWLIDGELWKYEQKFNELLPTFIALREKLIKEKDRLSFSTLPLYLNTELFDRYRTTITLLTRLIEDCSLDSLVNYRKNSYGDAIELIVYCFAIMMLTRRINNKIPNYQDDEIELNLITSRFSELKEVLKSFVS